MKNSAETYKPALAIIVPVFNEERGLPSFLDEMKQFADECPYECEIMYVDDGSVDGTGALLHEAGVLVHRHEVNLGYGAALKSGIQRTSAPIIVIIDSDGTYNPNEIISLVPLLEENDMVVGARLGPEAQIPWVRRPAKWMIRRFAEWMVRRSIPDLNSGLRAVHRSRIEPVMRLLPDGFSLTTTLTTALHAMGMRVEYLPIEYRKRSGSSKFHPIRDTWNMIMVILRTIVLFRPLNFFLPLSFLLAFLAVSVGIASKLAGEFMDATFIVLMMSSVQMFVLGLVADLIVRLHLRTH